MARKRKRTQRPRPSSPEEALEAFDRLYEKGSLDEALDLARAAVGRFPDQPALHHAQGLALWGLSRHEAAADAIQRAIDLDPSLPDPHLDLATLLVEHLGYPDEALRRLRSIRRRFPEPAHRAAAHALRGRAWLSLEDPRSAEREFRRARRHEPDDPDLAVDLAEARMEALDPRGAAEALADASRLAPEAGRPHWLRAVLLDRQGQVDEAARAFAEAARLEPDRYFVPERLGEEEFDRQVEAALASIPRRFRRHLGNTEIAVEPYPSDRLLREQGVSPFLLGLFVGTPLTDRSFDTTDFPPRILVFQRNLENVCRSRRELVREIGVTVRHEIGHLLGMEEEAIEEAGHG